MADTAATRRKRTRITSADAVLTGRERSGSVALDRALARLHRYVVGLQQRRRLAESVSLKLRNRPLLKVAKRRRSVVR